jgi:hypothetical protein
MRGTRTISRAIALLRSNWISSAGAVLTTFSFIGMVLLVLLTATGAFGGPYQGLVTFLVFPSLFVGGLILIPLGFAIYRSQLKERMEDVLKRPLGILRILGILTLLNVLIVGVAGYEGYHYMDSVEFCGQLCHEVMNPQYQTYRVSPHARVACVQCHIGPGASWFVKSKLSGVRQVFAVLGDTFPRPIPTPVANLRPARETCEQCHWPDKFVGDRLVVREHFRNDRAVTPYVHVLVMKTGGNRPGRGPSGIHWHVHRGIEITYVAADEKRRDIPWVKLTNHETGEVRVYAAEGVDPENPPAGETRTMDCIDCHNQPSHVMERAYEALDQAIVDGRISRHLPSIRRVALEALLAAGTEADGDRIIRERLEGFYTSEEPLPAGLRESLAPAVGEAVAIWQQNVFPTMNVGWGTYRSFQGHFGCLRCHDDEHRSTGGRVIPLSCDTCHGVLAFDEEHPEVLETLGWTVAR